MTKIDSAAERVANNVLLTAVARVMMAIGLPLGLFVIAQLWGLIAAMDRRIQTIEIQQAQMTAAQAAVNNRLTDEVTKLSSAVDRLGQTLSPLSQLTERMVQLDRRVTATEARNDAQEERLGRLAGDVGILRERIEPLIRASQQNLPGAPGLSRGR